MIATAKNKNKCSLVDYDYNSSDEEASEAVFDKKEKRKSEEEISQSPLPIPSSVIKMFEDISEDNMDDEKTKHCGRIRSFPHERGVWATYFFIKYKYPLHNSLIQEMLKVTEKYGIKMEAISDLHISLSRTVKLRHHWIQPLIESLKISLINTYCFKLVLKSVEVYTNEENTRTFLGFKVHTGIDNMVKIVQKVDKCLEDYKLLPFYKNPSFHVSIAWCLGNMEQKLLEVLVDLEMVFHSFIKDYSDWQTVSVSKVYCKSGNKQFVIPLKQKS
ncbi:U6 snRNA phosphodiesterase-like [Centruroides sculpturatus]|uniref:U6 snRNA phosphodiesterase-like n=1 Tax=Centruroides sculpturatus TaxID=218467 RepID=UPI000C6D1460|nr:U6 snRNA phosphodiesterase-like [Centruroides sculpturatus]